MEKRGSNRPVRVREGKLRKGKKGRREVGRCDKVSSCFGSSQTAAHLEHISELENLTRIREERGE